MRAHTLSVALLATIALTPVTPLIAVMSDTQYVSALRIAARKVARQKAAAGTSAALSTSMLNQLIGRPYQIGDHWEVFAWPTDQSLMRKLDDEAKLRPTVRAGGAFRYEVIEVQTGNQGSTLKITQLATPGFEIIDPRVEWLSLSFDDRQFQGSKIYRFRNQSEPLRVSPNGLRTTRTLATRLEHFPLDVPEVNTAERLPARAPELPSGPREIAAAHGYKPDLSRSIWFEQDDFFGRPVQMLWQKGDPWPVYMKTPLGIAILVSSGGPR